MATDSKVNTSSSNHHVTKEVESRQKLDPDHIFEVFLEIRDPSISASEILRKFPSDYNDELLMSISQFAYPCKTTSDEQSEQFTFAVLDSTGTRFRYGYCRRSNRESTCLCLISYYTWFETFYGILNDLFVLINGKSVDEVNQYLVSLYNFRLMSNEEFFRNEGKEIITISGLSKRYNYNRPDLRKLPSMLTSLNFTVMCTLLGKEILLHLFAHILFERRILFVSSKLFHLTACCFGCLQIIHPMHWQSIFLPILPSKMSWTVQCTAPYIIGVHSSVFATLNPGDLDDVVIINVDECRLESQHDDISLFPKYFLRNLKKGIEQTSTLAGDHLARVFLRAMAFSIGNYASGFLLKNEKLDFDRDVYLEQFRDTQFKSYMAAVANTQMFEQFSRYRTYAQLERETDIDEFDIEVKHIEDIKKSRKNSKKIYKMLEKAANPLLEQVQNKAEKLQTAINKAGQRVASEASSVMNERKKRSHSAKATAPIPAEPTIIIEPIVTDEILANQRDEELSTSSRASTPLIDFESEETLIEPTPVILNVIHSTISSPSARPTPQINPTIKQLQDELQHKVKTFDGKRLNPRDEYGQQQQQPSDIKRLVKQFDPLSNEIETKTCSSVSPTNAVLRTNNVFQETSAIRLRQTNFTASPADHDRHRSIYETIPNNHVHAILQNIRINYGTDHRLPVKSETSATCIVKTTYDFDPLAPSNEQKTEQDESNLIDFN